MLSRFDGFESNRPLEGSVQDARDGKNGKHVAHESVNNEFPLKRLELSRFAADAFACC